MTTDGRQWTCDVSKTKLLGFADDGARCADGRHWHRRIRDGFAGARPVPPVMYSDVEPAESRPLGVGGRVEEGD